MEEDYQEAVFKSSFLQKSSIQKQLKHLEEAVTEADEIRHIETAHNPEILYAIDFIENFLRLKKRVCYGGTAINAILPQNMKFYDDNKDLPDYDFFTPNPEEDLALLSKQLRLAGFIEVSHRVGIHEGTHKLLVNYVAVADITYIDKDLYKVIQERALRKDGIYYCDPDFLRMNMYLELSRPRGQVTRWDKVYERLLLLNHAFPIKPKRVCNKIPRAPSIPLEIRERLLQFLIDKKRILLGAEVAALYSFSLTSHKFKSPGVQWFFKNGGTVIFMSPTILPDSIELKSILGTEDIKTEVEKGLKDILPERIVIRYKDKVIAMIIKEQACHSYNTIHLSNTKELLIGSFDTLLTFYLAMHIFTKNHTLFGYSIACLCQKLIELSSKLREKDKSSFPPFSIHCSGYQKGFPTLLREKVKRILSIKKKEATKKNSKESTRAKTRKIPTDIEV